MAEKITNLKNKCACSNNSDDKQDAGDDLDCSLSLEKLNLLPRKKLLVLDVGGLLCQRLHRLDKSSIPTFRNPDASHGSILSIKSCLYYLKVLYIMPSCSVAANHLSKSLFCSVYKRPHYEEFIEFCFENFEVGIWSSATG
jgi:hypothetical protein